MSGINSRTKLMLPLTGNNGAKEIVDSGNTGHVPTLVGTANIDTSILTSFGNKKGVLDLDGNSDYITVPDHADFTFTGDMTFDTWVNSNYTGAAQVIIGAYDGTSTYHVLHVRINVTTGYILTQGTDGSTAYWSFSGSTNVADGQWHHIAVVRSGTTATLYVDGKSDGSDVSAGGTLNFPSQGIAIGRHSVTNSTNYFNGSIGDTRLSDTARWTSNFTPPTNPHTSDINTKLLLHMFSHDISGDGSSGFYKSPDFVGTAHIDDTVLDPFGQNDGVLDLDGNSDYLNLGASPDYSIWGSNASDYTLSAFIKLDSLSSTATILENYSGGTNSFYDIRIASSGAIGFDVYTGSGYMFLTSQSANGVISAGVLHHIAIVKVGTISSVYVDGVQVHYATSSDTSDTSNRVTNIGARAISGSRHLDGTISEFSLQNSNIFSASPNVGLTDTITVPTERITPYTAKGITTDTKLMLQLTGNNGAKEIVDEGITGHVGTLVGTANIDTSITNAFGNKKGTFVTDGNSDYTYFADSGEFNLGANDFTIDLFFNASSISSLQSIVSQWATSNLGYIFAVTNTGLPRFYYTTSGVGGATVTDSNTAIVIGKFYHLSVARIGNDLGMYLNGVQVAYRDVTGVTIFNSTAPLVVGAQDHAGGGANFSHGKLNNVRITNKNSFHASPNVGLTDTISVPNEPHVADANTKLLLHMFSHDTSGDGGGTEILDQSLSVHPITKFATADIDTTIDDPFGEKDGVFSLDGNSDYATIPDSTDFDITSFTDYTLKFKVKFRNIPSSNEVIFTQWEDNSNRLSVLYTFGSGFRFLLRSGAVNQIDITGTTQITDTNWHDVCIVKVGSSYSLYLDGQEEAYVSTAFADTFSGSMYIGKFGLSGSPLYFNGYIDDIVFDKTNYLSLVPSVGLTDSFTPNTVKTPRAVSRLLLLDFASRGNYHSPTFIGTADIDDTILDPFGLNEGMLELDGNSDLITLAPSTDFDFFDNNTDDKVIDLWVKHSGGTGGDDDTYMTQFETANDFWTFQSADPTGNVRAMLRVGGAFVFITGSTTTNVRDGLLHHIALIKRGNVYAIYVDGIQETYDVDNNVGTNTGTIGIGGRHTGISYAVGNMSTLRYHKEDYFGANPNVGLTDTIDVPFTRYGFNPIQLITPDAPTGLTATTFDADRIDLSWTAPTTPIGINIVGYKIERESPVGGGWSTLVADTGTTTITYSDTGLDAGTQYNYRVSAINDDTAVSDASNVADDTTDTTLPDAPTGLTAERGSTIFTIDVSWVAPVDDGGSAITGYKIERQELPSGSWTTIVADTGNTNVTHADSAVICTKEYNYRASTITAIGTSVPSGEDSSFPSNGIDSNTVVLLNFQETTGTPAISDSSFNDLAVSLQGNSEISGDQLLTDFENSLYTPQNQSNYIQCASDPAMPQNSSDWTIDFYMYITNNFTSGLGVPIYKNYTSASLFHVLYYRTGATDSISLESNNQSPRTTTFTSPSRNAWHHIAVTLNSSTGQFEIYIDGVSQGTRAWNPFHPTSIASTIYLLGNETGTQSNEVYYAYYRISDNIRWSSNFTPPTIPYGCPYTPPSVGEDGILFNKIRKAHQKISKIKGSIYLDRFTGKTFRRIRGE